MAQWRTVYFHLLHIMVHPGDSGWGGEGHFLYIKEGVMQGDPLTMIPYGLRFIPLIRKLQVEHPKFTQPWYTDDAGAGGTFP